MTGSDRFFCDVCTERKKKQKEQLEKESTQSQLLGGTEKVVGDSSITETLTHEIENINRETVNRGEEKVPFDRKSSFSSTSSSGELKDEKDEDEDTEMLESTKESDGKCHPLSTCVHVHICMYVCMSVRMYVHVCMYVFTYVCM